MAKKGVVRDFLRDLVDDEDGKDERLGRELIGRLRRDRSKQTVDEADDDPAPPAPPAPPATALIDPFAEATEQAEREAAEVLDRTDPAAVPEPAATSPSAPAPAVTSVATPAGSERPRQPETGTFFRDADRSELGEALASDFDLDGIPDRLDDPLAIGDFDHDLVTDAADRDDDADGFSDRSEARALAIAVDPDGDLDRDGLRNEIDPDVDGNGISNLDEQAAIRAAAAQLGDEIIPAFIVDRDNDNVPSSDDIDIDGDGKLNVARGIDFDADDLAEAGRSAFDAVASLSPFASDPVEPGPGVFDRAGDAIADGLDAARRFAADLEAERAAASSRGEPVATPTNPVPAASLNGLFSDLDDDGFLDSFDGNRDEDVFEDQVDDIDDDNDGVFDLADPDNDNDGLVDRSESLDLDGFAVTPGGTNTEIDPTNPRHVEQVADRLAPVVEEISTFADDVFDFLTFGASEDE